MNAPLQPADVIDMLAQAIAPRVAELVRAQIGGPEELWDARQVQAYLGIAPRTLSDWQNLPTFPARVPGPQRRWRASAIRAWRSEQWSAA